MRGGQGKASTLLVAAIGAAHMEHNVCALELACGARQMKQY